MALSFRDIDLFLDSDSDFRVEKVYAFDRMVYHVFCKDTLDGNKLEILLQYLRKEVKIIQQTSSELVFSKVSNDSEDENYIYHQYLNQNEKLQHLQTKEKTKKYKVKKDIRQKRKITFKEIDKILSKTFSDQFYYKLQRYYDEDKGKYELIINQKDSERFINKLTIHLQAYVELTYTIETIIKPIKKENYHIIFEKKYVHQDDKQYHLHKCFEDEIKYQKIII
ncbi:MAG: hypothetical protein ACI4U3_05800 [Traorella sp.]